MNRTVVLLSSSVPFGHPIASQFFNEKNITGKLDVKRARRRGVTHAVDQGGGVLAPQEE